jgi:hypothetical protein
LGKLSFCERLVHLNRQVMSFDGRPYLPAIYASEARNLVIRASRQVEKSTFLVNTIIYEACTRPGISILFVTPRMEQVGTFSHARLLPAIEESPIIRRQLLGRGKPKTAVSRMRFANGSQLFARAAFLSADASRGLSCQMLLIDEFQDIAAGDLPVLQEVLSHAREGRTILTGTPKSVDNHLETVFRLSTANEWTIDCPTCTKPMIMDERALGPRGITCADCQVLLDPRRGRWSPRHPEATWGDGFWINHTMVPWLNYDEIVERQRTYDPVRFKNEVIGLPTALGEHIVTREELEACCEEVPMAASFDAVPPAVHRHIIAGIDWGGGAYSRTVVAIGYMRDDFTFQVLRLDNLAAREDPQRVLTEVAALCNRFRVQFIGADGGGNGHVYNRMLLDKLGRRCSLYAVLYSTVDHAPVQDGVLWKWTVNRSATIGTLFARVKKRIFLFPRLQDCRGYLDEFACVVAEYDDHLRSVCYSHPETQPDDAMHACNYALILAVREFHARNYYKG